MRWRIDGDVYRGRAVDLRAVDVDGAAVADAVRGDPSPYTVTCRPAGELHDRVGHVTQGMGLRLRTALAIAARSRDMSAPQDAERDAIRSELESLPSPPEPAEIDVERTASPDEVTRRRERVATLRGRIEALREVSGETDDVAAELQTAIRELSEVETREAAAEQATERMRRDRRRFRDVRERRRRLEDRLANCDRRARAHLVDRILDEYTAAVRSIGWTDDPLDAEPVPAALAIVRVANVHAPIVVESSPFDGPEAAFRWLGTPVVFV